MKIKHQFVLLLIALSLIPVFFFIGQVLFDYFFVRKGFHFAKSSEIQKIKQMDLQEGDKQILFDTIKNSLANAENAFVFSDGRIFFSTIPEFEGLQKIDLDIFLQNAANQNDSSLYQITTLPTKSEQSPFLHITKFSGSEYFKQSRDSAISKSVRYAVISISIIAEIICIFFATLISHRISKSIALLEKNTERLADGKFETKIFIPKRAIHSNEITALSENLEMLRLTLKEQQQSRNRLIMGVSHDLKTPLAIIKGYTEAINDGMIYEQKKLKSSLAIIERKTSQLEEMIETLINFVKLNSNEWLENLREKDLREFFLAFANDARHTGEIFKRKVTVSNQLPKGIMVKMDEQLFARALENLLSNAIRYSKEGDTIYAESSASESEARISIRDTGSGIPENHIGQIFDLFYRASPSRREEGMGVGLSVVKNIIETHGWSISVQSEEGKGSDFVIAIPL